MNRAHAAISKPYRWMTLLTLNNARPVGTSEELLLAIIQAVYPDATMLEMRRELDYLADRALVGLRKEPSGHWFAGISRDGTDVVEYTLDCNPGIGALTT